MSEYVTDTHALIWHLTSDARLSSTCKRIFEVCDAGEARIWIPGIVLVETVYLVEKSRFDRALLNQMLDLIDPPAAGYAVAALDANLVKSLADIERNALPDMPDRIVAATAMRLGVPVLSKDHRMQDVDGLRVLW